MGCKQKPGIAAGVLHSLNSRLRGLDQKSMPPMPPAPAPDFFGSSAIMASVVISRAATEEAFWIAARTILVGSMMPLETNCRIRRPASRTRSCTGRSFSILLPTMMEPSSPALSASWRDGAERLAHNLDAGSSGHGSRSLRRSDGRSLESGTGSSAGSSFAVCRNWNRSFPHSYGFPHAYFIVASGGSFASNFPCCCEQTVRRAAAFGVYCQSEGVF